MPRSTVWATPTRSTASTRPSWPATRMASRHRRCETVLPLRRGPSRAIAPCRDAGVRRACLRVHMHDASMPCPCDCGTGSTVAISRVLLFVSTKQAKKWFVIPLIVLRLCAVGRVHAGRIHANVRALGTLIDKRERDEKKCVCSKFLRRTKKHEVRVARRLSPSAIETTPGLWRAGDTV